jgi:ribosome-binding factor A
VVADTLERLSDGDERLRMVTVTGIEVTADLRQATVYLSSLGVEAGQALAEHRGQLQGAIARQVRMKRTPHLGFAADPGVARGEKVERILRQLHQQAPGPGAEATGTPGGEVPGPAGHRGDA